MSDDTTKRYAEAQSKLVGPPILVKKLSLQNPIDPDELQQALWSMAVVRASELWRWRIAAVIPVNLDQKSFGVYDDRTNYLVVLELYPL